MPLERIVSIFRNGRNQAVRIPKEFEFTGKHVVKQVVMRKVGQRLILEPAPPKQLSDVLAGLSPLPESETLPDIQDLPELDSNPLG